MLVFIDSQVKQKRIGKLRGVRYITGKTIRVSIHMLNKAALDKKSSVRCLTSL